MTNKSSLSAEEEFFKHATISEIEIVDKYFKEKKSIYHNYGYQKAIEDFAEWLAAHQFKETEKPEDVEKLAEDWQKRFITYCMVKLEIDVEEIYSIIDYLKEHGYNAATGTK
jgi:hypothetical protein